MITSSTSSGFTCARSSAPLMATLPRSCAGTAPNAPLNEPTGVRAALAMTMSVAMMSSLQAALGAQYRPDAKARKADTVSLGEARKAVSAPVLAAHAMVHEKQPVGIVLGLRRAQPR